MSVLRTYMYTVWKFKDFTVSWILREIKFGEFKVSKLQNLTIAEYQIMPITV